MPSLSPHNDKNTAAAAPQVRVMVVDDSAVIRGFIIRAIESDPGIKVVGSAGNGQQAVDLLRRVTADVIILDIEMPVMDGLTAIPILKQIDAGAQIIMASTLTQKNAEISLKALALGATDYLAKPSAHELAAPGRFQRDLIDKVKTLGAVAWRKSDRQGRGTVAIPPAAARKKIALRPLPLSRPGIIAIGCSTGGPQALFETIKQLGADLPQPVVITQHMPPTFTALLAEHIARQCAVMCAEAKENEALIPGHYYMAPGDFHLLVRSSGQEPRVKLSKDRPENFCRPAVDPMLRSLVEVYRGRVLTVILTGMGQDGCHGCAAVVQAGGTVIAQDEASSVVWGMPGAVALAGLCAEVLPLVDIGTRVRKLALKGQP